MEQFSTYRFAPLPVSAVPDDSLPQEQMLSADTITLPVKRAFQLVKVSFDLLSDHKAWELVKPGFVARMDSWAAARGLTRVKPARIKAYPPVDPDEAEELKRQSVAQYVILGSYAAIPEGYRKPNPPAL